VRIGLLTQGAHSQLVFLFGRAEVEGSWGESGRKGEPWKNSMLWRQDNHRQVTCCAVPWRLAVFLLAHQPKVIRFPVRVLFYSTHNKPHPITLKSMPRSHAVFCASLRFWTAPWKSPLRSKEHARAITSRPRRHKPTEKSPGFEYNHTRTYERPWS